MWTVMRETCGECLGSGTVDCDECFGGCSLCVDGMMTCAACSGTSLICSYRPPFSIFSFSSMASSGQKHEDWLAIQRQTAAPGIGASLPDPRIWLLTDTEEK